LATIAPADRNAFCAPEIYRVEGELLIVMKQAGAAEERFRTAIEIARRRSEKSFELRAAISLARLWNVQRKKAEAYQLLREIYDWFTEGFATRDLVAAKALLGELGHEMQAR
jgi:hypothetical protein